MLMSHFVCSAPPFLNYTFKCGPSGRGDRDALLHSSLAPFPARAATHTYYLQTRRAGEGGWGERFVENLFPTFILLRLSPRARIARLSPPRGINSIRMSLSCARGSPSMLTVAETRPVRFPASRRVTHITTIFSANLLSPSLSFRLLAEVLQILPENNSIY